MQFALLWSFLGTVVGPLVMKVLKALGIGAISYVGINAVLDQAKDAILSNMAGLPADVASLMGLFKFDVAINITLAAVSTRFLLAGVNSLTGTKKKIGSISGD